MFITASDLAREQKLNYGDDIACQLRLAKKKRFNIQEERRIAQEIELQSHLNKLLREDKDDQLTKIVSESEADAEDKTREIDEQYVKTKCLFILSAISFFFFL